MDNLKTFKLKRHAGIDDLEGMLGDFATEWWTDEDWAKWNEDAPNRAKRNEDRIAKLKEDGEYGKEYEIGISFVPHPLFDEPQSPMLMSSSFFIMDLSKKSDDDTSNT